MSVCLQGTNMDSVVAMCGHCVGDKNNITFPNCCKFQKSRIDNCLYNQNKLKLLVCSKKGHSKSLL